MPINPIVFGGILVIAVLGNPKIKLNLDKVIDIESSRNTMAFNRFTHARGILQITPVLVEEWNNFHPKDQLNLNDLHIPSESLKVGRWYLSKRIPQMLKHFKQPVTKRNILICWNAGIKVLLDEPLKGLPKETQDFLVKYETEKI